MRVVQFYSSALRRQVGEAVRIRRRGGSVLNSRSEFNRCSITRLTLPEPLPSPRELGEEEGPEAEVCSDSWVRRVPEQLEITSPSKRQGDKKPGRAPKRLKYCVLGEDWGMESGTSEAPDDQPYPETPSSWSLDWKILPQRLSGRRRKRIQRSSLEQAFELTTKVQIAKSEEEQKVILKPSLSTVEAGDSPGLSGRTTTTFPKRSEDPDFKNLGAEAISTKVQAMPSSAFSEQQLNQACVYTVEGGEVTKDETDVSGQGCLRMVSDGQLSVMSDVQQSSRVMSDVKEVQRKDEVRAIDVIDVPVSGQGCLMEVSDVQQNVMSDVQQCRELVSDVQKLKYYDVDAQRKDEVGGIDVSEGGDVSKKEADVPGQGCLKNVSDIQRNVMSDVQQCSGEVSDVQEVGYFDVDVQKRDEVRGSDVSVQPNTKLVTLNMSSKACSVPKTKPARKRVPQRLRSSQRSSVG